MLNKYFLIAFVCILSFTNLKCSLEEERLIKTLFKSYNKLIRPVRNSSDYVTITMDLVLLQLINVVSIDVFKNKLYLYDNSNYSLFLSMKKSKL